MLQSVTHDFESVVSPVLLEVYFQFGDICDILSVYFYGLYVLKFFFCRLRSVLLQKL